MVSFVKYNYRIQTQTQNSIIFPNHYLTNLISKTKYYNSNGLGIYIYTLLQELASLSFALFEISNLFSNASPKTQHFL